MNSDKFSDEIDLFQVLLKILRLVKSNIIIITAFFLVGSLLGVLWYSASPKIFESKMLISSEILTESYSAELIDNLNVLIKEGNISSLAEKLNLSENECKEIKNIEIQNADTKSDLLKEKEKVFLTIRVFISKQAILPKLQTKLIGYLENNEFVHIRVEQKRTLLVSMIKKINEEISGLEEFKNRIYKGDFFASTKGNIMFDPTSVNTKILELTREKIESEHALQTINSVQIIDGFTIFQNPTSPKLSISLTSGSFVGLFFVSLFLAFKGLRKVIRHKDADDI